MLEVFVCTVVGAGAHTSILCRKKGCLAGQLQPDLLPLSELARQSTITTTVTWLCRGDPSTQVECPSGNCTRQEWTVDVISVIFRTKLIQTEEPSAQLIPRWCNRKVGDSCSKTGSLKRARLGCVPNRSQGSPKGLRCRIRSLACRFERQGGLRSA